MVAYLYFSRFVIAALTIVFVALLYKNLPSFEHSRVIVKDKNGKILLNSDLRYNIIGRRNGSDIRVFDTTVSRVAFVLERIDSTRCVIHRVGKGLCRLVGTNQNCDRSLEISSGEKFRLGDSSLELEIIPKKSFSYGKQLILLVIATLIQFFMIGQLYVQEILPRIDILIVFAGIVSLEWCYCGVIWALRLKNNTVVEIIAFLLTFVGLVLTGNNGEDLLENSIFVVISFLMFLIATLCISWYENVDFMKKRTISKIAAVLIVIFTILLCFMPASNGARISLQIGGLNILLLPFCELIYIAILADYDPLTHKNVNRGSMILALAILIFFAMVSVIRLNELGSLLILIALLFISIYFRTGNLLFLIFAGVLGIGMLPVMTELSTTFAHRIAIIGTALDVDPMHRTQLSEALSLGTSGGLFGVCPGAGQLVAVPAAESDLIFALAGEELGLVMLLLLLALFGFLVWIAMKNSYDRRYSVHLTASLAASLIIIKVCLAVLGTYNILALTGLSVPFLSQGNVNIFVSWLLLAFLVQPFQRREYDEK